MRSVRLAAALTLSAALAPRASAGPDEADAEKECRAAFAELDQCLPDLAKAYQAKDKARIAEIDIRSESLRRRFRSAFARVPVESWTEPKDHFLLEAGLGGAIDDARARGDDDAARRWAEEFVARSFSRYAFETRGLALPELELAAGHLDAAVEGFRAGARHGVLPPGLEDRKRAIYARLRIGDVKSVCGDIAGARADYAEARKALEGFGKRDEWTDIFRLPTTAEIESRELVGTPMPPLPDVAWIGDPPSGQPKAFVVYLRAPIAYAGDAGRLRALDRLYRDAAQCGVDVRIIVREDAVGGPRRGREGRWVSTPRGPTDGYGDWAPYDPNATRTVLAQVRENLGLRVPIGLSTSPGAPRPSFDTMPRVLVADRSGTIVLANADSDHVDWVCGLARLAAAGKKPRPPEPAASPTAAEQEARRATCSNQLAALVKDFQVRVRRLRLQSSLRSQYGSGSDFWTNSTSEHDERAIQCPSDDAMPPVSVFADNYLRFDGHSSYAGPDLVRRDLRKEPEDAIVGACLHHPAGALIARANGKVEFLTLKELGIASEEEKTVGPESKSPVLRGLLP